MTGGVATQVALFGDESAWRTEATDLLRGVAGGMLFGTPLLFTMEVWGIGAAATPAGIARSLGLSIVPVFLLVQTAGFRRQAPLHPLDAARETVEAIAVGIVTVTAVLVLLGQITLRTPAVDALGKIVFEGAPFALGAAVASHLFRQARDQGDQGDQADRGQPGATQGSARAVVADRHGWHGTAADLGSTIIGALFVSSNIAPTAEIPMLAAAASPLRLLAIVGVTLIVTYAIVFGAGFGDQQKRREQRGVLQHPLTETTTAYLVALVVAAAVLLFFGNLHVGDPWPQVLDHAVLLGLPAAVGGAAGRLAV